VNFYIGVKCVDDEWNLPNKYHWSWWSHCCCSYQFRRIQYHSSTVSIILLSSIYLFCIVCVNFASNFWRSHCWFDCVKVTVNQAVIACLQVYVTLFIFASHSSLLHRLLLLLPIGARHHCQGRCYPSRYCQCCWSRLIVASVNITVAHVTLCYCRLHRQLGNHSNH